MNIGDMKNIVVLKNLPSNLVEEAIVVLKANQKIKKHKYVKEKTFKEDVPKVKDEDYILKEAEMVVSNYITKMEEQRKPKEIKILKKYNRLKIATYLLSVTCWIQLVCLLCK